MTPTVTSGISRVFLFKIIGAFTSALKICLIFSGTFPSIAPLIPPGISTPNLGPLISKPTLGTSIFGPLISIPPPIFPP